MANAARVGECLQTELRKLADKHTIIGDVRGLGLMVGAELVKDRETREPLPEVRDAVVDACFQRGLLLLGCGKSTLRFCPPLVVDEEDVEIAIGILDEVLATVV